MDTGGVEPLHAVPAQITRRPDVVADLDRFFEPLLAPVRRQVARRLQKPLFGRSVLKLYLDAVADMRIGPQHFGDPSLDLAFEVREKFGDKGMMRQRLCARRRSQRQQPYVRPVHVAIPDMVQCCPYLTACVA